MITTAGAGGGRITSTVALDEPAALPLTPVALTATVLTSELGKTLGPRLATDALVKVRTEPGIKRPG